ncbi:hypothetical protein Tco_0706557 [Tanacetum coccineum]|uniref:Uncharacterized protein n=1 Tax=Tanacetum coccineum TaxID=301880 RepID=A0ABQ4Y8P7_9ASTR
MSETEHIPPTSSVTALRIPIIKKGEYDLWSMKMRQYIAITDHILWDIITNGNQTTTDPASPSVSAPKTSLAANARRNNEKALNILLSAIPDRHLLSFHDAENRENGRNAKRMWQLEIQLKRPRWQQTDNEDIDWTKEFDAEPVTYAMMALTGVEQDDWSMEFDAEQGYQISLESLEAILKTREKNKYAWGDKYEQMEYDLKIRDLKLEEKQKELDQAVTRTDDFKVKLRNGPNASRLSKRSPKQTKNMCLNKSCIGFGIESSNSMESDISFGDETLTDSAYENFKREKAYKAVPPPTGLDNRRPRISSYSPSSRSSTTRTPHRPHRPKKIVKSIWVKKGIGCSDSIDKRARTSCVILKEFKGGYLLDGAQFNLLSVLKTDKKHNVLFTDKECLILSPKFKFVDEDLVILRAPRKNDVYSLDLKNIIPSGGITVLVAKATED